MSALDESYARAEALTRAHGTTYYWSTRLLPPERRRHVYAIYAFCRYADDVVDEQPDASVDVRGAALDAFGGALLADLAAGHSRDPILAAVVDTSRRFGIDGDCYRRFLRSMAADLTVASYATFADLLDYMDGSAAVIGEMMLPVLAATDSDAVAPARDLGIAFQLTNFLRDVGEDLDRGRLYLPREDVEAFGADPSSRRVTPEWIALMRYEIERARAYYASADDGIALLPPRSARCIRAARVLYAAILDEIEANGYDVFTRRARLSLGRKLATVTSSALRSLPRRSVGTIGTRNP